jgi:phosphatidylserine decarboxylase
MEYAIGAALAIVLALPVAARWQIPLAKVGVALVAIAVTIALGVGAIGAVVPLGAVLRGALVAAGTLGAAAAILAYRFYRDPDRTVPDRGDVVISPADGKVVYVYESKGGELPVSTKLGRRYRLDELTRTDLCDGDAIVIGISMNLADVHVNRAPIAGRVTLQRRYPGTFGSLRHVAKIFENERATTVIAGERLQVAVVQIASRLVRRIASFVETGDDLQLGTRIGAIRFGSQVDVVISKRPELVIATAPGDRVVAGESVIARVGGLATPAAVRSGGTVEPPLMRP